MIFLAMLMISLLLSISTSLLLIRLLNPVIVITTKKIFSAEMQPIWLKYVQIAFFIFGTSSGVNLYGLQDFIQKYNKTLSIERLIAEGFHSVQSSAISIMIAMLVLFFVFLIVSYLNQLSSNKDFSDLSERIKHPFRKSNEDAINKNAIISDIKNNDKI